MYQSGLNLEIIAQFENHDGFDGIVLGYDNSPYHLEFTHHNGTTVGKSPTKDNLLVWYVPDKIIAAKYNNQLINAGFKRVKSYNPYWDKYGKTFEDIDGYRVVISGQNW